MSQIQFSFSLKYKDLTSECPTHTQSLLSLLTILHHTPVKIGIGILYWNFFPQTLPFFLIREIVYVVLVCSHILNFPDLTESQFGCDFALLYNQVILLWIDPDYLFLMTFRTQSALALAPSTGFEITFYLDCFSIQKACHTLFGVPVDHAKSVGCLPKF